MKKYLQILPLFIVLLSCYNKAKIPSQQTQQNIPSNQTIAHQTQKDSLSAIEINALLQNNRLTEKVYPNMSSCGGYVLGYYYQEQLKLIHATYQGELGFTSEKVYWNNNKIIKIVYQEYLPEWDKYNKIYPPKNFEFDSTKMTYSDTTYSITFGDTTKFQKIAHKKVVSSKKDTILIQNLVNCAKQMKSEVDSIP